MALIAGGAVAYAVTPRHLQEGILVARVLGLILRPRFFRAGHAVAAAALQVLIGRRWRVLPMGRVAPLEEEGGPAVHHRQAVNAWRSHYEANSTWLAVVVVIVVGEEGRGCCCRR